MEDYEKSNWYQYLDHGMQDLVGVCMHLLADELAQPELRFHDYSFIVFPLAKAYEGFLKKYLLDSKLIDRKAFEDKHFRIGRSLNPQLPEKFQDEGWLYDDLTRLCGKSTADLMWQSWRSGRNKLFHYFFPDHVNFVSLKQAGERVDMIVEAMEVALECGVENGMEMSRE